MQTPTFIAFSKLMNIKALTLFKIIILLDVHNILISHSNTLQNILLSHTKTNIAHGFYKDKHRISLDLLLKSKESCLLYLYIDHLFEMFLDCVYSECHWLGTTQNLMKISRYTKVFPRKTQMVHGKQKTFEVNPRRQEKFSWYIQKR